MAYLALVNSWHILKITLDALMLLSKLSCVTLSCCLVVQINLPDSDAKL